MADDEWCRYGRDANSTQIEWDPDPGTLAGMQDLLNWNVQLQASQVTVVRCIVSLFPSAD